jgi:hypothetical protein
MISFFNGLEMNDGARTRAGCPEEQGSCPYKCYGLQKVKNKEKPVQEQKTRMRDPPFYAGHPLGRRAAR